MSGGRCGRRGRLTLGVAISGYGAIAHEHARALSAAGARLVAVAGPDRSAAQRFAAAHGVETVADSLASILERDEVGAVVIASPNAVHAEQAAAALEAGRHVLVEIPLALSLADGERLVALAASRSLVLGACHTLRFWEPYVALSSLLAESSARVRHVVAHRLLERRDDTGWSGRRRSWTDDLLWHHGGHIIDAVLQVLTDDPVMSVTAAAADPVRVGARPTEYAIALRTAGGAIATIALSYGSRLEVADLMVLTDAEAWHVSSADLRSSHTIVTRGEPGDAQVAAIRAQDAAFVAACLGGTSFPAPAASVLPTLRVQQRVADLVGIGGK